MTDNQRNARVMWRKNNTYGWSQQTLTGGDAAYIRHEARLLDASGEERKTREEINSTLEERATANRARKEKTDLRKSATKEKLNQVLLLENHSYEALSALRVKDLDLQIDKLREQGDSNTPAKSTVRTKEAKVKAIMATFERRKSLVQKKHGLNVALDATQPEVTTTGTLFPGDGSSPEEHELCFDDEVIF
ncbi:hypothetical protein FRC12_004859 [Ceratobasidium sp. 428]|nr:hypothetical protein FRC12_004859 [Ceratobasidium sp. 428]